MVRLLSQVIMLIMTLWSCSNAQAQVSPPLRADWRLFEIPQSHTTIEYPAIFAPVGASSKGVGERFQSRDGATLSVYALSKNTGETPSGYLQNNLQVSPSAIEYKRISRTFFAISMERRGTVYYSRCNFSSGSPGALHCFDLTYPRREKQSWDPIVTRMSLSLRPLEG